MPKSKSDFRVGFFVDGYTLKKVNEYYRFFHRYRSRLDFRGLKMWARSQAARCFNVGQRNVQLESHYYHPYRCPLVDGKEFEHLGVLRLECQLMDAGMQVHYNDREDMVGSRPNMGMMEDAMLFAAYHKIDAAILLTTQGQFSPLPTKLKLMGIPTMLLGWNFTYPKEGGTVCWKTDSLLRESCGIYVAMEKVAEGKGNLGPKVPCLFQKDRPFIRNTASQWAEFIREKYNLPDLSFLPAVAG